MSPTDRLEALLPEMRRYARAVCGSAEEGDHVVGNVLRALVKDIRSLAPFRDMATECFSRLDAALRPRESVLIEEPHDLLEKLNSNERRALLLTAMQGFSKSQAARVMGVSIEELSQFIEAAYAGIHRHRKTSILIIEDEPLIAASLKKIISQAGHTCAAIAHTAEDAKQQACRHEKVGLILSDIRLADGSSGAEAVQSIQAYRPAPVVFITAYPNAVLEEYGKDGIYVVRKPFHADEVRTVISQALLADAVSA